MSEPGLEDACPFTQAQYCNDLTCSKHHPEASILSKKLETLANTLEAVKDNLQRAEDALKIKTLNKDATDSDASDDDASDDDVVSTTSSKNDADADVEIGSTTDMDEGGEDEESEEEEEIIGGTSEEEDDEASSVIVIKRKRVHKEDEDADGSASEASEVEATEAEIAEYKRIKKEEEERMKSSEELLLADAALKRIEAECGFLTESDEDDDPDYKPRTKYARKAKEKAVPLVSIMARMDCLKVPVPASPKKKKIQKVRTNPSYVDAIYEPLVQNVLLSEAGSLDVALKQMVEVSRPYIPPPPPAISTLAEATSEDERELQAARLAPLASMEASKMLAALPPEPSMVPEYATVPDIRPNGLGTPALATLKLQEMLDQKKREADQAEALQVLTQPDPQMLQTLAEAGDSCMNAPVQASTPNVTESVLEAALAAYAA